MNWKSSFCALLLLLVSASFLAFLPETEATILSSSSIFSANITDGYISNTAATYSDAQEAASGSVSSSGTFARVGQDKEPSVYVVYRVALLFDTSSLPDDANITDVQLSLYMYLDGSAQDFNITVQNGQPIYPHEPIDAGDFYYQWYSGNGGSWNTSNYGVGYINITLNSDGRSWIQKTSTTKLMLRDDRDISATPPTGDEYVNFYLTEYGSNQPKLFITYSVEFTQYNVYGPFYENGLVAPYIVNVTCYKPNAVPESFLLNGAGGADTYQINATEAATFFVWNITSPATNKTRTMYATSATYEDIYIFVPTLEEPYYLYTFTVTDFAGVTNGFLETVINVNGTNRVVERFSLDVVNSIPFWMTWAHRYELRLVADEGTYNYGAFIALNVQEQSIIITTDMFPPSLPGQDLTVNALRRNATWIQINYTDNDMETYWVHISIKKRSGYGWGSVYSTNNTGNTQQVNWYSADSSLDYRVIVTALRSSQMTWTFSCPKPSTSTNPWEGLLDGLGTLPFPVKNLVAFVIVLCFAAAFSYINIGFGSVMMVIIAAVLAYLGWLTIETTAVAFAFCVAIMIVLHESKKKEREV